MTEQESLADATLSAPVRVRRPLIKKSKLTDATNRHSTADKRLPIDGEFNSNNGRIKIYFRVYEVENRILVHCILIVDHSGGTPTNINVIYTLLKSTFSGFQFSR